MAKSIRFELNSAGVVELLQSEAMSGIIANATERVAEAARSSSGLEYTASVRCSGDRVKGRVSAGSAKAHYHNLKHNTLVKALGGTRI